MKSRSWSPEVLQWLKGLSWSTGLLVDLFEGLMRPFSFVCLVEGVRERSGTWPW